MVLDTVTGEVVTVRELLNRDRSRSSPLNGPPENTTTALGQSAGGKRKLDEGSNDEDAENKRKCY